MFVHRKIEFSNLGYDFIKDTKNRGGGDPCGENANGLRKWCEGRDYPTDLLVTEILNFLFTA